jgi:hypothetical protein
MKTQSATEQLIASLVETAFAHHGEARQLHLYRESLRSLVRLAKSEQLLDMRTSVRKLVGVAACTVERSRKSGRGFDRLQGQFEFK